MMNNKNPVPGLLLLNLGVFFTIAAFLPRAGSYSYSGPISEFLNARMHWDIALVATIGSTLFSTGFVLLPGGRATTNPK